MTEYKLFLAGKWTDTVSGEIMDDINPADGSVCARVHTAGPAEVEAAIAAAVEAQPKWAALLPEDRERVLLRAADHMEQNLERYAAMLIDESGSAFMKAMDEVAQTVNIVRSAAAECRREYGGVIHTDAQGDFSYWYRQPLGVVAGIGPFNYPLLLCATKVFLGLAAGNAFLLKPSSDTPLCAVIMGECLEAGGLPEGVFSGLPGSTQDVGEALVADERIRKITFTGSTAVGTEIAKKAAAKLKKYTLEMGGKNPSIVLADFDVDKAVDIVLFGAYFHQGQICMANSRVIVEAPIYDEFCEKLTNRVKALKMGDPHDPMTIIGPLINAKQCLVIDEQIADAVKKGARLLCGGTHEGNFYTPSLLADVTPEMTIFYEESFGPITSVIKAADAEDALRLCNDNKYGLSSALLTNDLSLAFSMAPRIEAGMVHINDSTVMGARSAPFGGVKMSGTGREGANFSIEEFTETKWVTVRYADRGFPPM